jgi:hypothetical protein
MVVARANHVQGECHGQVMRGKTEKRRETLRFLKSLLRGPFFQPTATSLFGGFMSSLFIGSFSNQPGNFDGMAKTIDCNVSEVTRIRVTPNAGQEMLRLDADADLH